jgi:PAS domain S-box-containing protein
MFVKSKGLGVNDIEIKSENLDFYKFTVDNSNECIIWLDDKGKIIYVNNALSKLSGYTKAELKMMHLIDIDSSFTKSNLKNIIKTIKNENNYTLTTSHKNKNGNIYFVQMSIYRFCHKNKTYICAMCQDISENIDYKKQIKKINQELKKSIEEKETFLREIHHRVKNNMEIISSLLNMQYRRNKNKNIKYILQESVSRINAMALVHEFLYLGDNLFYINLKNYITRLIEDIKGLYLSNKTHLSVDLNIDELTLSTNRCIQIGMVLHELSVNSLKYAFKENRDNLLCIYIKNIKNNIHIKIRDNGDGVRDIDLIYKNDSIGMQLIHSIVEDQLDGTVEFINNRGLECNIYFSKKEIIC